MCLNKLGFNSHTNLRDYYVSQPDYHFLLLLFALLFSWNCAEMLLHGLDKMFPSSGLKLAGLLFVYVVSLVNHDLRSLFNSRK